MYFTATAAHCGDIRLYLCVHFTRGGEEFSQSDGLPAQHATSEIEFCFTNTSLEKAVSLWVDARSDLGVLLVFVSEV